MMLLITGCGGSDTSNTPTTSSSARPSGSVYEPPDEVRNATVVWSAEPGIDLFSTAATLARAARESDIIGSYAGLEHTYPGYAKALDRPYATHYDVESYRGTIAGTMLHHIQRIQDTGDGYLVEYCALPNAYGQLDDGRYRRWYGRGSALAARFTRNDDAPAPATTTPTATPNPAPDPMHWQAPTYNVFTGWTVSYVVNDTSCDDWALSLYPDAPVENEISYSDTPPPVQPAYPGWPTQPD
ncbi:hypothetical protein FOH10_04645 [Nocardia otitidiscaviarum]|uniref:Uncharacterized protein n=1 Tax=Nocardia otitidiscaviarum TaxID=1823 RepID=A0A516NGT9_9NOCA|nr:hypothetical protein [Nocardia otitidiscaviarum]MCP9622763.1 hypothetical protein [Nocardia otitidiscaviarum]QDP78129.1 hypothetical protein FOH10_04645 [Nocardia otitidiscaviarum]